MVGGENLTPSAMAGVLGDVLGRPIAAQQTPIEVWADSARRAGLSQYQIDTLTAMFKHYDKHGFVGNSNVLGWLLGRAPTTFREFVERLVSPPP